MTSLTNVEIAERVSTLTILLVKDHGQLKPHEEKGVAALADLITNLLQNINEIAASTAVPRRLP